jgi:serine phosphatase RsbU (regulator of sigma subunit)
MVTSKAIALLADGVRDGAAARAAHDYLYTARQGKVSATLNIVSVDMVTKTLVLSRNSHCPIVIYMGDGEQRLLDDPAPPIGVHRVVKPQIAEYPIEAGMLAVVYTDGVEHAGSRGGCGLDAPALIASLFEAHHDAVHPAQQIADAVLAEAVRCDDGRPQDDISVLVVAVVPNGQDAVRRLQATLPIPPLLLP